MRITTKQFLQIAVAIGALVPISAGLSGMIWGTGMLDGVPAASVTLDSHFRYLSGLLLGIGICFCTTIPAIEHKKQRFQLLTFIVFIGGLGRLFALIAVGVPDKPMLFGLAMELIVTPLLAVWQRAVARRYN